MIGCCRARLRWMAVPWLLAAVALVGGAAVSSLRADPFDDYRSALAAYRSGRFSDAERLFTSISEKDEKVPETLKSRYFLARTEMRLHKWDQASTILRAIYSTSPSFYSDWSCDYLLGECRKALGEE